MAAAGRLARFPPGVAARIFLSMPDEKPSPSQRARRILLVDADAFFVQIACQIDPEGAGRAAYLLVGGSSRSRGVVTSASYSARPFGVRSGMSTAQAVRLCPQATVVPVPRRACTESSRAIVQVLEQFTPVVEPASIDEMYLDLTGTEALYKHEPLSETATRIREAVRTRTGIAVSVGGGTTRLVAKLAAGRAKPHQNTSAQGVVIVPAGDEAEFLRSFELADIPGVGPRFQERLARLGLRTVPDALAQDHATLVSWLGDRAGSWLHDRIRGTDPTAIISGREARSISRDETFGVDLTEDTALERELLHLVDRATADLRADGATARTITVKLRDFDFNTRQASRTLPRTVISDRAVFAVARELLARLRRARSVPARLIGVALSNLGTPATEAQLRLFPEEETNTVETDRDRTLAHTIDRVRDRFGRGAVRRALDLGSSEATTMIPRRNEE